MDETAPDLATSRPPDLAQAALRYAARGWPVFPCRPADSAPLVKDGFKQASTDPAVVAEWWRRWPEASIGLPTGESLGAWVLDIDAGADKKTGEIVELADLLAAIEAEIGGPLPETPQVVTPRGGRHLYFRLPQGVAMTNRQGVWRGDGQRMLRVDVRAAAKGYVIAPPSRRPGVGAYAWIGGKVPLADAPEGLLRLAARGPEEAAALRGGRPAGSREVGKSGNRDSARPHDFPTSRSHETASRYALAALDRAARDVASAPSGTRNGTLNDKALQLGHMVAAGMIGRATVEAVLTDAALACGLDRREIAGTLRSGLEAGMREPFDVRRLRGGRANGESRMANRGAPIGAADDDPSIRDSLLATPSPPQGGAPPDDSAIRFCAGLDHSDTDNATRLIKHFGRDLAVMAEEESKSSGYLVWTGTHWDRAAGLDRAIGVAQKVGPLIALEIPHLALSAAEQALVDKAVPLRGKPKAELPPADLLAITAADEALDALKGRAKARRSFAVTSKNAARIEKMLAMAAPHLTRHPDLWNPDPLLVATADRTLVFRVAEEPDPECPDPAATRMKRVARLEAREGHRREDWCTKALTIPWQPEATAPRWRAFLERFLPDAAVRDYVQVAAGLGLLGVPVQRVVFHYGSGANGKSVFLETLCRVLGPLALGLPAESITGRDERQGAAASPDLARLYGVRLCRVLELPPGVALKEDLVKKLTGGERIPVRTLFKGFFEFQPQFIAHLSGNGFPKIEGQDNGIWRRLDVVHWPVQLAREEMREFEDVLRDFAPEYPGILAWLVEGARRFLEEGLVAPEPVRAATAGYREEMDPVGQFAADCVKASPGDEVGAQEMYDAYKRWSEANARAARTMNKFAEGMLTRLRRSDKVPGLAQRPKRYWLDCRLENVPIPMPGEFGGGDRGAW